MASVDMVAVSGEFTVDGRVATSRIHMTRREWTSPDTRKCVIGIIRNEVARGASEMAGRRIDPDEVTMAEPKFYTIDLGDGDE